MHRVLLTAFLLWILPNIAHAEWVAVGTNASTGYTYYVDPRSIYRDGNVAKIWTLFDYHEFQTIQGQNAEHQYLSETMVMLFKCNESMFGIKTAMFYSNNMAKGELVAASPPSQTPWLSVSPRTAIYSIMNLACN